jgi:hypothetical protein
MVLPSYNSPVLISNGVNSNQPIATACFISKAFSTLHTRRLSVTIGIQGSTGAAGDVGGFTGTLLIQGTDEIWGANGVTGSPFANAGPQPGYNGSTGGLFWNTIPSGTININNGVQSALLNFTDVGPAAIRFVFNQSATGPLPNATACGSGTMNIYLTAKQT